MSSVYTLWKHWWGRNEQRERFLWEAFGEKHPLKLAGMGAWMECGLGLRH